MKERPILFSAPMVRAILEGRKTQTRRVVKPQPAMNGKWMEWCHKGVLITEQNVAWHPFAEGFPRALAKPGLGYLCPYGHPGDRLWVRETTVNVEVHGYVGPVFAASDEGCSIREWGLSPDPDDCTDIEPEDIKLRPAIHMPKAWARIWLEVTGVRVERLQDICGADALAEGIHEVPIPPDEYGPNRVGYSAWPGPTGPTLKVTPEDAFRELWESINGVGSWDANPWVWVVEFNRVTP